ncbi:hypothetical protein CVT24_006427 [Panaeolus cyanescens]|uniref:Nephrocystin 3-like N-terminal domain-containing protein n=1 Tax=Panaeolus cyanescens TaxID=181874 RepID=A0A409VZ74_9AGAR|nr:hypothetical protein CVT24_006427 [Panaeolus cyanescens]
MFHLPEGRMIVSGGNFTTISGGVYHGTVHQSLASPEEAMKRLYDHVAQGATHDSGERFDAPKCHPDTRVAILEDLITWATNDFSHQLILWLYGAAGAGKSAIMQSIALRLEQENRLSGSFFFSRTGSTGRNDDTQFAATLAYQLIKNVPQIKPFIMAAIHDDPGIFDLPLPSQLDRLIIKPLLNLPPPDKSNTSPSSRVIIVDGLDECLKPESQKLIIDSLAWLSEQLQLSPTYRHKIIIASRPEYEIKTAFLKINPLQKLHLNEEWNPSKDILRYLKSSFEELKKTHPISAMIPKRWPSQRQYDLMLEKSSHHFIFASTLIKYVKSPRHDPRERLDRILEPGPLTPSGDSDVNFPTADLDALYRQVLSSVPASHVETVRLVLRMALIGSIDPSWQLILPSKTIQLFLELPEGALELAFVDLGSVLTINNTVDEETLHDPSTKLLHASFLDFLMDERRSKEFWIDDPTILRKLIQRSVDLLWKGKHDQLHR